MKNKRWIAVVCAIGICLMLMTILLPMNVKIEDNLGSVRLNVETYRAGKNQLTHPSVVVFPESWHGAKYWLAYSPYPYSDGEEENPCLSISNDMYYWETPVGLANPIADNEETGCDELKDPHLLYREDLDRLEMWYLGRLSENLGGDGNSLLLMRKYSYDGCTWSDYEIMLSTEYLSPTVHWDGEKYQLWGIGYSLWNTEGTVAYQESKDGFTWTEPTLCSIGESNAKIDIWHGCVTAHDGAYHFAFIDESDNQEVFYCSSTDGIHFTTPEVIIENNDHWNFLYRPALVYDADKVYCLYGVVNHANQWYISMSSGSDIYHLKGLRDSDISRMYPLSDAIINAQSLKNRLKNVYSSAQDSLRFELLACAITEVILVILIKKFRNKKFLIMGVVLNFVVSFAYVYIRIRPYSVYAWIGAILSLGFLNISMAAILQCVVMHLQNKTSPESPKN